MSCEPRTGRWSRRSSRPNLDHPEERLALWHPDGVKELPFAPAGLPTTRWEGRDEIVANTVNNSGMFADCVHRDLEIQAADDPELFFVTSRMVPEATFLGEPYPQSFIHVIRVRDGKVILQQGVLQQRDPGRGGARRTAPRAAARCSSQPGDQRMTTETDAFERRRCPRSRRRRPSRLPTDAGARRHPMAGRARRAGRPAARHRHRVARAGDSRTSLASPTADRGRRGCRTGGFRSACIGMPAATPSGRALVWVHGGAFIGGNLDMPESELGRARAWQHAASRSPRWTTRSASATCTIPCRPMTCSPRGGMCADAAEQTCSGVPAGGRSPSAARARAGRSRPERSRGCATRGSRRRPDSCWSTRSCTPMGLLASDVARPHVAARAARR